MLLSLCDDCPYMTICKRVEHRFSFSSALYQLILLQNAKLVGNCGLCHVQCFCQVADAYLCLKQDKQNLDPRGITKYLEKLCQIVKLCFIRHGLIDNLYQIFMNLTGVTALAQAYKHSQQEKADLQLEAPPESKRKLSANIAKN